MKWACPKCQSINLTVMVTIHDWAILVQESDGSFETRLEAGDHEWDNTSAMECRDCGHGGYAGTFTAPASSETYVKVKNQRCPACFSTDITGGPINIEGEQCTQEVWCLACSADWYDVYELKGYTGLDHGS